VCAGYDLFGFPGGFSFGDDIASGRIFAMKIRERLYPALRDALARGCPMIGACNGFQVLVQVGLLPGPADAQEWPLQPPARTVALSDNQDARFCDRWVPVEYVSQSVCVWTRGLGEGFSADEVGGAMQLPVAHGEGRFVTATPEILRTLHQRGQVAVRYADNYNGSQDAIAGICDPSGLVLGLMPHPERFLAWNRHPWWTRLSATMRANVTPGLRMFQNAVRAVEGRGEVRTVRAAARAGL
jgi:phosphoribosylformylglycinamidine synthase subunit PurQ / glutaminase